MYIEYIKESENQIGKLIPIGRRGHVTNEAAKELIKQGIAIESEDPENYAPYPDETTAESSVDENETDNGSAMSSKKKGKNTKRPRKQRP